MQRRFGLACLTAALLAGQLAVTAPLAPGVARGLVLCGLAVLLGAASAGARAHRSSAGSRLALATAGALALGAGLAAGRLARPSGAPDVAAMALPWRGRLAGDVQAPPRVRDGRTHLVLAARWSERGERRMRRRGLVRLTVRGALPDVALGDRLLAPVTLRRPRNFATPGSFDVVGHLARRGIHATAFVWRSEDVRVLRRGPPGWRRGLEAWRRLVAARIAERVPGRRGAVLQALVVGERDGVDDDLRDAFAHAGMAHVLAISGLHVAIVAWAALAAARALLARSAWLVLRGEVRATA